MVLGNGPWWDFLHNTRKVLPSIVRYGWPVPPPPRWLLYSSFSLLKSPLILYDPFRGHPQRPILPYPYTYPYPLPWPRYIDSFRSLKATRRSAIDSFLTDRLSSQCLQIVFRLSSLSSDCLHISIKIFFIGYHHFVGSLTRSHSIQITEIGQSWLFLRLS